MSILFASVIFIGEFFGSCFSHMFIGSSEQSKAHSTLTLQGLSSATGRNDWLSLERMDVPLRQCVLSRVVNQSCFDLLLNNSPNVHSKTSALSSEILHAGNWLHMVPSAPLGLHLHH